MKHREYAKTALTEKSQCGFAYMNENLIKS